MPMKVFTRTEGQGCVCVYVCMCEKCVGEKIMLSSQSVSVFFLDPFLHPDHRVLVCWQFRRGEWPLFQLQPPGPPGVPRLWPGPAHQLPGSQPAARVLPLPLRQRLWPVPQIYVTELLHRLWTVSTGHVHRYPVFPVSAITEINQKIHLYSMQLSSFS